MTGLRTVGGQHPGPWTFQTNLYTNPSARTVGSLYEIRRNHVTNPNLNVGTTGWGNWVGVGSITADAQAAYSGAMGGVATVDGTQPYPRVTHNIATTFAVGDVLTLSARIRKRGTWTSATQIPGMYIRGPLTAGGEFIITTSSIVSGPDANGWYYVTVSATVPSGATGAVTINIGINCGSATEPSGAKFEWDEVLFEKSNRLDTYFDGTTAATNGLSYTWTGTANASASVAQGKAPNDMGSVHVYRYQPDPSGGVVLRADGLTTSIDTYVHLGGDFGGFRLGMQPGRTYTASAEGFASAAEAGEINYARCVTLWYKSGSGTYIMTKSTPVPVGTTPTRVSVSVTIPTDATEAFVRLYNGGNSRDVTWNKMTVVEGSGTSYIDGSLPPPDDQSVYVWNGTADASTSSLATPGTLSIMKPDGSGYANMTKVSKRTNLQQNPSFRATLTPGTKVYRTNLVSDPRATASVGLSTTSLGWGAQWYGGGGGAGTTSYVTGAADGPSADGGGTKVSTYIRKTWTVAPTSNQQTGFQHTPSGTPRYPVTAGEVYSMSSWIRTSSANKRCQYSMAFYDSTGTLLTVTSGTDVILTANTWMRICGVITVPANAVGAEFLLYIDRSATNQTLWAPGDTLDGTAACIEKSNIIGNYFDGQTNEVQGGYTNAWVGAANKSMSTLSGPDNVVRRNLATRPMATGSGYTDCTAGWGANWYGSGATGTTTLVSGASDGPLPELTAYLRKTWTSVGTVGDTGFNNSNGRNGSYYKGFPVAGNTPYAFSGYFRWNSATVKGLRSRIVWYDYAGTMLRDDGGPVDTSTPANTWGRTQHVVTSPAGACFASCWVVDNTGGTNWAIGDTLDGTGLLIEQVGAVLPYFDGNTLASNDLTYVWPGANNGSQPVAKGTLAANWYNGNGSTMRTAASGGGIVFLPNAGSYAGNNYPVTPGQTVTLLVDRDMVVSGATMGITFMNSSGGSLGGNTITITANGLQRVSGVAPAGATTVVCYVIPGGSSFVGKDVPVRSMAVFMGPSVDNGVFFDGSTPADADYTYAWSGTANASTSIASP